MTDEDFNIPVSKKAYEQIAKELIRLREDLDKVIEAIFECELIVNLTHPELSDVSMNTVTTRQYMLFKKVKDSLGVLQKTRIIRT